MNSLCICTVIICLLVASEQSGGSSFPHLNPPARKHHPEFWGKHSEGQREFYLQSKNIWYITITKNGVAGSKRGGESAIMMTVSVSTANRTVALKGKDAKRYLCIDNSSTVYPSEHLLEDCYFVEEYDVGYNTYQHAFHRRGNDKVYLAIDNDGKLTIGHKRLGQQADDRIFFVPVEVKRQTGMPISLPVVTTSTPAPTTTLRAATVPPVKRKLEKTRKRRRRWCKYLIEGRLTRNPQKYVNRCKRDCDILAKMLDNPKRYKRKCLKQRKKRRRRNRRRRGQEEGQGHHIRHRDGHRRTRNSHRGHSRRRTPVNVTMTPHSHTTDVT